MSMRQKVRAFASRSASSHRASSNIVWAARGHVRNRCRAGGRRAPTRRFSAWDIKKGELVGSAGKTRTAEAQVTAIGQSRTDPDVYAVGYEDGSIRLWDSKIATVIVQL